MGTEQDTQRTLKVRNAVADGWYDLVDPATGDVVGQAVRTEQRYNLARPVTVVGWKARLAGQPWTPHLRTRRDAVALMAAQHYARKEG